MHPLIYFANGPTFTRLDQVKGRRSPTWVQGPKHLHRSSLLSQAPEQEAGSEANSWSMEHCPIGCIMTGGLTHYTTWVFIMLAAFLPLISYCTFTGASHPPSPISTSKPQPYEEGRMINSLSFTLQSSGRWKEYLSHTVYTGGHFGSVGDQPCLGLILQSCLLLAALCSGPFAGLLPHLQREHGSG